MAAAPTTVTGPSARDALLERGVREALAIEDPDVRRGHVGAWLLRLARLDPERAVELLAREPTDDDLRARVCTATATRLLAEESPQAAARWSEALAAIARVEDPGDQLHLFNELCEAAILQEGEGDSRDGAGTRSAAGIASSAPAWALRELASLVDRLGGGEGETTRALACALLGEAMIAVGDPEGEKHLARARELSQDLAAHDAILAFLAQTHSSLDPELAADLSGRIEDPATRLETRIALLERAEQILPALRHSLRLAALEDAAQAESIRRVELTARIAANHVGEDRSAAREIYERALGAIDPANPQLQALQVAGVAASVVRWDPAWGSDLFQQALQIADSEPEPVRRVVAKVAVAFQLASFDLERGQAALDQALAEAQQLEAMWELAHLLEVLFDARGRPDLELSAARPVLEAALARVSEDDLRLPGVLGLPDVGRCYLEIDPPRAREIFARWLDGAARAGDSDGMIGAALAILQADPQAGMDALQRVAAELADRGDCVAMTNLCQAAWETAPELVAEIARAIPASRERNRSAVAAAGGAWSSDPEAAHRLLDLLPGCDERSAALLTMVDRFLGTGDLPRPYSESEVNTCCSLIPQMDDVTRRELAASLRARF